MAIINITDASGNFQSNVEPTWATVSNVEKLPAPSALTNTGGTGNINGRGAHLGQLYDHTYLGLDTYDPRTEFVKLMSGDPENDGAMAVGASPSAGAGQYFGTQVTAGHLTYADAPNLSTVDVGDLNIPNPYVPDISAGKGTASVYKATFENKHPGTKNSFPPAGKNPNDALITSNTLDLNAGDGTLSPHHTSARLGGWMSDTTLEYGRWQAEAE